MRLTMHLRSIFLKKKEKIKFFFSNFYSSKDIDELQQND